MGLRDRIRKSRSGNPGNSVSMMESSTSQYYPAAVRAPARETNRSSFYSAAADPSTGLVSVCPTSTADLFLGKFVNIAFCGAKGVGKSKLINGIVGKHIAQDDGKARTHPDGHRFNHPMVKCVSFCEIQIQYASKRDFRNFDLVVVVFNHSVSVLDVEAAKRAAERDVPVLFVCTRADQQVDRFIKIMGHSEVVAVRKVRELVNSKADQGWFKLPEVSRQLFVVSGIAMHQRECCYFDELELIAKIETYYTPANTLGPSDQTPGSASTEVPDTQSRMKQTVADVERSSKASQITKSHYQTVSTRQDFKSAIEPLTAPSSTEVYSPAPGHLGTPAPSSEADGGANVAKVAFLEDRESCTTGPTLMESLLGFSPTNASRLPTIVQGTPYKHPEYPNSSFYCFNSGMCQPKSFQKFFVANRLNSMRLIVVVFDKHLRDVDIMIAKEARKFGVDVIVAYRKVDDSTASSHGFSPRRMLRRIREHSAADIRKTLNSRGLDSVTVFIVNPRILRIPDSYPRSDEESFKEYIVAACGGRGNRAGSRSQRLSQHQLEGAQLKCRTALDGSTIFAGPGNPRGSGSIAPRRDPSHTSEYNGAVPRSSQPPPSVKFVCRSDILVAVVGARGCGKTTLVRNSLDIKQPPRAILETGMPWMVRHPAYYDLMIHDFPGYSPQDPEVGTTTWVHQQRFHTMDWIILVFVRKLCEADICICQFAINSNIPIVLVATKMDVVVDDLIYDLNLTEKAAVENSRFNVLRDYRTEMEKYNLDPLPLFLVIGRSIDRRRNVKRVFDELQYLEMIESKIAGILRGNNK